MILMLFVMFYVYCLDIVYVYYIKVNNDYILCYLWDFFIFRDVLSI